jgi:Leucine-rich repeat (LRR) protein
LAKTDGLSLKRLYRQARASGSLNLSNKCLTEVPQEVCNLSESIEEDEKFWECVDLAKLDLCFNNISSIPTQVANVTSLTSLKISNNRIDNLPEEMFDMHMLRVLHLNNNQLTGSFPARLGDLSQLAELCLSDNQLTSLVNLTRQTNKIDTIVNPHVVSFLTTQPNPTTSAIFYRWLRCAGGAPAGE